jgi:hypothetical protein
MGNVKPGLRDQIRCGGIKIGAGDNNRFVFAHERTRPF